MKSGVLITKQHALVVRLILIISLSAKQQHFVISRTHQPSIEEGGGLRRSKSPSSSIEESPAANSSSAASSSSSLNYYGTDISFAIHHSSISTNYPWLPHNVDPENNPTPEKYKNMPIQPLGDRQKVYNEYMDGCNAFHREFVKDFCSVVEKKRLANGLERVVLMKNFTKNGFKATRVPSGLFSRIQSFWTRNREKTTKEHADVFFNTWLSPTMMVYLEDSRMEYGDDVTLKDDIFTTVRGIIEEWTGLELREVALYGIRVYYNESILIPHVDTLPRVASAIINVDQDVDEDWPLEVIGHDGRAYNITSKPGDLILYESHSIFHGRPFSMKGRFFANIFVHFEPTGYSVHGEYLKPIHEGAPLYLARGNWTKLKAKLIANADDDDDNDVDDGDDGDDDNDDDHDNSIGGQEKYNNEPEDDDDAHDHTTEAGRYATVGDIKALHQLASRDAKMLHERDSNGWQPIHEAARYGHEEVVELLLQNGADVNALTEDTGGSVLYWALQEYSDDHSIIKFLKDKGAVYVEPEPEL